jgi:hypothetical protein
MTLTEFLANKALRNAWVMHENIDIYVRRSFHVLDGKSVDTFDLANMNAPLHTRGHGELWAAIDLVKAAEPERTLYIENVLNERLAASLRARGWTETAHLGEIISFFL